jgi:CubicO group peptidase (beta-lactamase class C family)
MNGNLMRFLAPTVLLALFTAAPLAGQQGGGSGAAGTPTTPSAPAMGAVAQAMLAAVNAGDAEIGRFVEAHASPDLSGRVTARQYAAALRKLREQSGEMELVTTMPGGGAAERMLLRSKGGGHFLGVELGFDPERPDRFAYIGFHPMLSDPRTGSGLWTPEGEGDDAALIAHVQRSVAKLVADDHFSGVVLVARGDDVLLEEAYGLADLEQRLPNALTTRYHVGSIDKMFTAVAIAQLVEQGLLGFDDTLGKVLPGYPNAQARQNVTIRHLLTHSGGVGDPFRSARHDPARKMDGPQSEWFPLFADEPLRFEPGSRHEYSNGGYLVLGAVVEELTGQRYHEFVRDHVFQAAGMTDTEPGPDGAIPNAAMRYYREPLNDPLAIEARIPKVEAAPGVGEAMGGSYLTARDLMRFARALRTNRLLSPAMTDTVVTGKVPVGPGNARYAFGFYDVNHGTPVRGHSGGGAGSGIDADLEIIWDADHTVVVVGNYDTPASRAVAQGIVRLVTDRFRREATRP